MSFYQDVDSGSVQSTMVLAVPRSVSSALAKSLSVSPDFGLYIFQPFYGYKDRTKELVDLNGYIQKAQQDKESTPDNPLKVLMKVMAESLSGQRFYHLMTHSQNICALLRDPQSQALSAFRAYWGKPSGTNANEEELKSLKAMRTTKYLKDFIVTPWENMKRHVHQLERETAQNEHSPRWVVMDGDAVRSAPEQSLKRLCSKFDITYSSKMIDGWNEEENKTVGMAKQRYRRSWLGRVQQTNGIKKPTSMTPRLEDFSQPVREQIEQNLKTYVQILAHEQTLAPSPNEIIQLMKNEGFHQTCPIACYALVSVWPDEIAEKRDHTLATIRVEKPEYSSSFDIIDRVLGHEMPTPIEALDSDRKIRAASR